MATGMSLQEVQRVLDEYIGLSSQLRGSGHSLKLHYTSPTGVELFHILLTGPLEDGNYSFGGTSSVMPESWNTLCDITRLTERMGDIE